MTKPPTIYSLARDLQVHPSTVSRAFSRPELVRAELREAILTRAEEVDYRPNAMARGLITGRTGMIGLLVPDIENPFFPPLVRAVQQSLALDGQSILLLNSDKTPLAEAELIERVRSQVDAFVLVSPRSQPRGLVTAARGLPLVFVNREVRGSCSLTIDSSPVADAAELLRQQGHSVFALLRGPRTSWSAARRRSVVETWASAAGVELQQFGPYEADFEGGISGAAAVVESGATAVLAFDDVMAAGAIAGFTKAGLSVPGDVSIVGCDDVLLSRIIAPSLTTIAAPYDELGIAVAELIGLQLSGGPFEQWRALPGRLVIRDSTGPLRTR